MPELPEVETVARQLAPQTVGRRIEQVRVGWSKTVGSAGPARFRAALVGARIEAVRRRAKYLLFDLSRDRVPAGVIVGHLRMSGRLHVVDACTAPERWCRVELDLESGHVLRFVDVRKFGRLQFARHESELLPPLGPEPLESGFTSAWLRAALAARARQLKPLLLDQSFLAGLGNIYVDESLFAARLHPQRLARQLSGASTDRLHAAIRETLMAAIRHEGSSFDAFYRTPEGQPGRYQEQFAVYGRTGLPCLRCRRPIRRLVVGQRGTHVCTRCQVPPRVRLRLKP